MVHKRRGKGKGIVYNALVFLANIVEHHINAVLDIRNLASDGVRLSFHQSSKFSSFVCQVLNYLLNLWETNLSLLNEVFHLTLSNTKLLCKLTYHRNASAGELV